ncbi:uncharacterized protein LOC126198565 [Schistocerca nitens]|uniref:uncharacterized protein LOC126198565 n=1 Tax=Schistocerca nitens TaxID=7011 RepID=UPI0021174B4B|nr:uncharacterized protein LOC126198565 [Schistocerca nitens]
MAEVEESNRNKQIKKRTRNPSEWQREKRKRLRVAGKSYINSKGDVVQERKIGEDCKCRRKCYKIVTEDVRNKLFDGYYSLKSHDEQNAYLFGLIRKYDIARKRCKDSDRRTCSYRYFVRHRGKEVQVCRLAFAHIHGISAHKIRILCQKQDQNVMYPRDGRGKHDNRPTKISDQTRNQIKEHIYSIIKSDRVREFFKEEKHSGPDVNITKMWKDYLLKYDPNYCDSVSDNEKVTAPMNHSGNSLVSDNLQLPVFTSSLGPEMTQQQHLPYSNTINLSHYHVPSMSSNLELFGNDGSQYEDQERLNSHSKQDTRPPPIIKHWLYSKVFHEEFKLHDFVSLKKKLCSFKDSDKSQMSQQANKSERKQKTPKKISRDKDSVGDITGGQNIVNVSDGHNGVIESSGHLQMPPVNSSSSPDMYILPVNLQDLPPLNQPSEMLHQHHQHHTMQLNLHTYSTPQASVINPLVHNQPPCTAMMGPVGLSQNSCGAYAPAAAFY